MQSFCRNNLQMQLLVNREKYTHVHSYIYNVTCINENKNDKRTSKNVYIYILLTIDYFIFEHGYTRED